MKPVFVRFHCTVTDEPFDVYLHRKDEKNHFRIKEIRQGRKITATGSGDGEEADSNVITDANVVWDGFECPWCETASTENTTFVKCNRCNRLMCSAGIVRDEQGKLFTCGDECGSSGYLSGVIESYDAAEEDDGPPQLSGPNRAQLNAPPKSR